MKFLKSAVGSAIVTFFLFPLGVIFLWLNNQLKLGIKILFTVLGLWLFITFTAADTSPPVISTPLNVSTIAGYPLTEQQVIDKGVTSITDNRSNLTKDDIKVEGYDDINFEAPGKYPVTFTATDDANNQASEEIKVRVKINYNLESDSETESATDDEQSATNDDEQSATNDEQLKYTADSSIQDQATAFELKATADGQMVTVGTDVSPGVYQVQVTNGTLADDQIMDSYATIGYSNTDIDKDYPANTTLQGYSREYVELESGDQVFGSTLCDVTFTPLTIEEINNLNNK